MDKELTNIKPLSPEARENEIINKAVALAEKRIDDGTASNTLLIHYLKLATVKSQLDNDVLETKMRLEQAKIEAMESSKRTEELYESVIDAMKRYSGNLNEEL